jgi:hypothetical protein
MDLKFVSHGLWSEKQNILRQHMHRKEFWILTNKSGNKLKQGNEVEGPCSASLTIASEKQTSNLFHLRWSKLKTM